MANRRGNLAIYADPTPFISFTVNDGWYETRWYGKQPDPQPSRLVNGVCRLWTIVTTTRLHPPARRDQRPHELSGART
jgi:hypothetical protein